MSLELSVVIVTLGGQGDLERCLEALRRQGPIELEIIVPKSGAPPPALRAAGIREASAPIVALTEDHCIPSPDWAASILRAHAAPSAAAGGSVEKTTPDTALNWAVYLADYLRYAAPLPEGPAAHLTDCNVSYKRAALDRVAACWRDGFHENVVHDALRAAGETLWLAPSIVVAQRRSFRPGAVLRDRLAYGRLFAATRAQRASLAARVVLLASTTLLPALLVARVAVQVIRKRRHAGQFLRSLPWLAVISTAWAVGEFLGYLTARPPASLAAPGESA